VGDSPGCVAVPDMVEFDADTSVSGEAGHHRIGEFQFDLSVENIEKFDFVFKVSEERAFGYAGEARDGGGRGTQSAFREYLCCGRENRFSFVATSRAGQTVPSFDEPKLNFGRRLRLDERSLRRPGF
jgi:hypothetical protein